MNKDLLYFYLHPFLWPKGELPDDPDVNWSGFSFGPYTWTIQTYLRLKKAGVSCVLTSEMPDKGIVIAHRESWHSDDSHYADPLSSAGDRFIVDVSCDLNLYTPANIHIVQNPSQTKYLNCYYLPHWPQPGIVPRDPARGHVIENVAFFGNQKNLAPEFKEEAWGRAMKEMGLNFISKFKPFDHTDASTYGFDEFWNNYSDIDAIIAVRSFGSSGYDHKPASKLFNAWLAGVPSILGRETAYSHYRKSEFDFIEVNSMSDVIVSLKRLQDDELYWSKIMGNAAVRSREITHDKVVDKWIDLIEKVIIPEYRTYINRPRIFRRKLALYKNLHHSKARFFSSVAKKIK